MIVGRFGNRTSRLLTVGVVVGVAVAFADSSIVVLALPQIYGAFDTSIVGVSWVLTSYNLVVAACAIALVPLAERAGPALLSRAGFLLFATASVGCAAAPDLPALIVFRCVQGAGAAMLLTGALALLSTLGGSRARGLALWVSAGTFGAACGPALGGILTELADWRAIFAFQAPVALVAAVAALESHARQEVGRAPRSPLAPNIGLALVFAALVGALFLAVLLVITGWGLSPIAGAAVVSALPVAAIAARPLARDLPPGWAAVAGACLLASGLIALALLPATSAALAAAALALCGVGLGLAVPVLTHAAVRPDVALVRDGTVSVAARHVGLVVSLALVAPLLTHNLVQGGRDALLSGTKVLLDGNVPIQQKVPIALDLRATLEQTPKGAVPDLAAPFNSRGAAHDPQLRAVRDSLISSIEDAITRSFRPSFLLTALFALLATVPILSTRRRSRR